MLRILEDARATVAHRWYTCYKQTLSNQAQDLTITIDKYIRKQYVLFPETGQTIPNKR